MRGTKLAMQHLRRLSPITVLSSGTSSTRGRSHFAAVLPLRALQALTGTVTRHEPSSCTIITRNLTCEVLPSTSIAACASCSLYVRITFVDFRYVRIAPIAAVATSGVGTDVRADIGAGIRADVGAGIRADVVTTAVRTNHFRIKISDRTRLTSRLLLQLLKETSNTDNAA